VSDETPKPPRTRRYEKEPLERRVIRLTRSENERIERIRADQGISLSQLVADTLLAEDAPMTSAQYKQHAAELMSIKHALNRLVDVVREGGQPVDGVFIGQALELNQRLYNLTEDQVRGKRR
jgi:hypothetical protein